MRAAACATAEEAVAAVIATTNLTEKGETDENIVTEPAVQVVHHHHHALPSHLPAAPAVQAVREMIAEHDSCRYILPQYRILFSLFSCLLYTSPSPRDGLLSRMPSSA